MKLHFEPNLDYQHAAIESVCGLFRGQEICRTEFTVSSQGGRALVGQGDLALGGSFAHHQLGLVQNELGVGNRLSLLDGELLANLQQTQLRNGLAPSASLASGDFTIEMETGTGKTYVYLRTIFELNKRYGFTKFVIVVPSVAIKEGVYKTLQITQEHFRSLYAGVPVDFFLYESARLGPVRNFATSQHIQVMVITVGAINKQDVNNLYKDSEKTGGEKPIDLIRATHPIIIVDEPQSVDGGLEGRGKEALDKMNPLCTLRYSATHANRHHQVFRLDAVDAYERKLVKQIEVASATVDGGHNKAFVRLLSVSNKANRIRAVLQLDVQRGTEVAREQVTVQAGTDLEQCTQRPLYAGYLVEDIGCRKGAEYVQFSNQEAPLRMGESMGDVDADAVKRLMIRRTIEEHLNKELRFKPLGIKVLSLFFIDVVENYRQYDSSGAAVPGKYAQMFEEEYLAMAAKPRFGSLFQEMDLTQEAAQVHGGYFSIDKKGKWQNTDEGNQSNRDNAERAYNLIMKDKEKLLGFETRLKFIFSHSALREGWDNPNVFQICALREIGSERERRQTIGRGLRLCVNQSGERQRGFDVNTLTVVATESYEEFAAHLQKEMEADTGIRFGMVERHQFAAIALAAEDGSTRPLGVEQSAAIWDCLHQAGWVDAKGKVQDALRTALKDKTFALPQVFAAHSAAVSEVLKKLAGGLVVKNADERKQVKTRQAILQSAEFKALWDRIKHKTTYRLSFDNAALLAACIKAVNDMPVVAKTRLQWRKADLAIGKGGIDARELAASAPILLEEQDVALPDVLTELQDRTQLTRRSLVGILTQSVRLDDFKKNPQQFIDLVANAINHAKRKAIVDGIKYQRIGEEAYYAQELFDQQELMGYLKNMLAANKSVHEYVVYDASSVEKGFAEDLESNDAVKLYAKLPGWFRVPTPLGSYNPDWAVLVEKDGAEKLYFVVETKASLFDEDLRGKEDGKIQCGKAHFKALDYGENPATFMLARHSKDLMARVV